MTYEEVLMKCEPLLNGEWKEKEVQNVICKALEKQIPKRHIIEINSRLNKDLFCANCGAYHGICGDIYRTTTSNYCPFCGQAIDWSDEK